jgi:hypothetical protein
MNARPGLQAIRFPRILRQTLALPLVALALLANARSQDGSPSPAKVPLSLFCFDYATGLKSVQVKRTPSQLAEVKLSTANVVDAGEVATEGGKLLLYGFPEDTAEAPVVASSPLGDLRQPLMILAPSGEQTGPAYRSHLIDRDPANFPPGSCLFANLTPHPVRIMLGEQKLEIAAGADLVAKPAPAAGEVIAVTVECQVDGHWQPVSSSRLAQRDDRRSLVTLHLAARTGRVMMKSIPLREAGNTP